MPPVTGKFGSTAPVSSLPASSTTTMLAAGGYYRWKYAPISGSTPARMQVNFDSMGTFSISDVYTLSNNGTSSQTFSTAKSYQIITNTVNVFATAASFSVNTIWNDPLSYTRGMTAGGAYTTNSTQSFFHYSTPPTTFLSNTNAIWSANGTFSANRGITDFKLNEIEFGVLGFSYYKRTGTELQPSTDNSLGWYYDKNSEIYYWYDYVAGSPSTVAQASQRGYFPVGGSNGLKRSAVGYRLNNALYKFVPYTYYNISFNYQNTGNFPLRIYTSNAPILSESTWASLSSGIYTPPSNSILLATITQSIYVENQGLPTAVTYSSVTSAIPVNFYGVKGNQYLLFVGGFAGASSSSSTYSSIYLSNIKIEGGYHPGNNKQYVMSNTSTYSTIGNLLNATYSTSVGTGNTINATSSLINPGISKILSKIGNGSFKAGIWENGVWNTGWRVDDKMYEFTNVSLFFNYNKSKRWRVQITGPETSVSQFNIGDNISISNIVAIDINEDRKLIKGYYTIINKTSNSIIVEFDNNFPLRRIERDSDNHRIYATKNVWLSGGFLNGYFTGIWNYGLFKGYPLITEMYNTHWIDGVFDGGHFYSERYTIPNFVDTVFQSGNVGLTFSSPHGLSVGDLITINKNNKDINPQYDGEHTVTQVVNSYQIVTDISWGSDSLNEGGQITVDLSKGLLQNVDFKSNNISKVTSNTSMQSNAVFVYNSWMDVVYDDTSASNIGKPQNLINAVSRRSYSENNLYGYITNDILESSSTFRDSFSNTIRRYKLGTKYKIFADYVGDAGMFEDDFGGNYTIPSLSLTYSVTENSNFINQGWTYSYISSTFIDFQRVSENTDSDNVDNLLKVTSISNGGILDITPNPVFDVNNRTNEQIQKLRYTKVEFDLVTFSSVISTQLPSYFNFFHPPYYFKYSGLYTNDGIYSPHIHFDNLNFVTRTFVTNGVTSSTLTDATYLPVYRNINHLMTSNRRKSEYFYNKRNLSMNFHGYSRYSTLPTEYYIDNLHFYEVDMIPFFQYFTEDNINKGVQVPFQGISPFIDYSNENFSFINNISIGLDSINTQNSNTVVSGVGLGVGGVGGGINNPALYETNTNNPSFLFVPGEVVGSGGFSDIRLKENIIKVGQSLFGINIYEWNYINSKNRFRGVMAQELLGTKFEKSLSIKDGFYWVDYSDLDVKFENI